MGKFTENLKRRLGIAGGEVADPMQANMERPTDPALSALKVTNTTKSKLFFVSILEQFSILEESRNWKAWQLEPGASEVIPHQYWTVSSETGEECSYTLSPAPKGKSDFIYKVRPEFISDKPPCTEQDQSATPHHQ